MRMKMKIIKMIIVKFRNQLQAIIKSGLKRRIRMINYLKLMLKVLLQFLMKD